MTLGEVLRPTGPVVDVVVVDVVIFDGNACVPVEAPGATVVEATAAGMISCAFHNDRPPAEANHLLPGAGAGYVIVASAFRGENDTAGTAATAVDPLVGRADVVVDASR